ncbi:unnamed protein product [Lampetra fluviatilis]
MAGTAPLGGKRGLRIGIGSWPAATRTSMLVPPAPASTAVAIPILRKLFSQLQPFSWKTFSEDRAGQSALVIERATLPIGDAECSERRNGYSPGDAKERRLTDRRSDLAKWMQQLEAA